MELSDKAKQALSRVVESSATSLADALDSSGKLVSENVKELGREVILFHGYVNNATSLLGALLTTGLIIKSIYFCMKIRDAVGDDYIYSKTDREMAAAGIFGAFLCLVPMVAWFAHCITQIFKAKFAPRLFLTEYATKLIKGDNLK